MSTSIITVKNISKKYNITHQRGGYIAMRDVIANIAKKPLSFLKRRANAIAGRTTKEIFWALKDLNFEIQKGEAVGIIGANGAGKSTLLKILTGITPPTTGEIKMHGKVASLLEVGTGFHQELTGRENIFLNGAILGMTKQEIVEKFDAIVEFSGVKKFIDTPVKRYSSGMMVRLGFSVAAHMEPDILLVDEVLAVGDAEFQKRCLGKMNEVTREGGRTILFVSHNLTAVQNLCQRCILLEEGKIKMIGETKDVIDAYLNRENTEEILTLEKIIGHLPLNPILKFKSISLSQNKINIKQSTIKNGAPLEIEINYKVFKKTIGLRVYFDIQDTENNLLFRSFHDEKGSGIPTMEPGDYISTATIPANIFAPTQYELKINATIFNVNSCFQHSTIATPLFIKNTGKYNQAYCNDTIRGKLALSLDWNTKILKN